MEISYRGKIEAFQRIFDEEKELQAQRQKNLKEQLAQLLQYTIAQVSEAVQKAAGQKVGLLISGLYQAKYRHRFGHGWETTPTRFVYSFAGIIDSNAPALSEKHEIPVKVLIEQRGSFPFAPSLKFEKLPLNHVAFDDPSWSIHNLMLSSFPSKLTKDIVESGFMSHAIDMKLYIGDEEFKDFLKLFTRDEGEQLGILNMLEDLVAKKYLPNFVIEQTPGAA